MTGRVGFRFRARLADGLGPNGAMGVRAAFTALVTARGLEAYGTSGGETESAYLLVRDGESVGEADRRAIAAWAASRDDLAEYRVGPLVVLDGAVVLDRA